MKLLFLITAVIMIHQSFTGKHQELGIIDLPEEFNQIKSGDTLVITKSSNNYMKVYFYHHRNCEDITNKYLYIVQ